MENSKQWYSSKSLWINVIMLLAIAIQKWTGFIINPEDQVMLLALINLVLRAITGKPVNFSGKTFFKNK